MSTDKKYIDKKIQFCKNLHSKVFPQIAQYEAKRKQYLLIFSIVTILIVLAICFIVCFSGINNAEIMGHLLFFLGVLPCMTYAFLQHSLQEKINKSVMKQLCKGAGDFKWSKGGTSNNDIVYRMACVIPDYDRETRDDNFVGTYNDVNILIDEVNYERKYRTKNGTRYSSVFRGVVISLAFNKNFNSHTVVKNNSLFHLSPSRNLKHTVLEDVHFEKLYDVYTDDEIDARYILTTSFMDRLNRLKLSFKSSNITCAFFQNTLYISINARKDMFFMGSLIKSILDEKQYYQVFDEFYSILNIIDVLKLNQKIGL